MSAHDKLRHACSVYDTHPVQSVFGINIAEIFAEYEELRAERDDLRRRNDDQRKSLESSRTYKGEYVTEWANKCQALKIQNEALCTELLEQRDIASNAWVATDSLRENLNHAIDENDALSADRVRNDKEWDTVHEAIRRAGVNAYDTVEAGINNLANERNQYRKQVEFGGYAGRTAFEWSNACTVQITRAVTAEKAERGALAELKRSNEEWIGAYQRLAAELKTLRETNNALREGGSEFMTLKSERDDLKRWNTNQVQKLNDATALHANQRISIERYQKENRMARTLLARTKEYYPVPSPLGGDIRAYLKNTEHTGFADLVPRYDYTQLQEKFDTLAAHVHQAWKAT